MGLKHRAVEQNDRFGGGVGGVAEVVNVAGGTKAAEDGGPGWGGHGLSERTAGDGAVVSDADARALAPDIGPPRTGRCGPDDGAFFGAGLVVGRRRGWVEFAVDFRLAGLRNQWVQQWVGAGQCADGVGGRAGDRRFCQ